MKGVILAGGRGTRLMPLTKATNKHLLPVGREPMLYHPLRQMVNAGLEEVLVVTSSEHMGHVVTCLGSGDEFGCSLSYKVQPEPRGIADALRLAEDFARDERICVFLGDNIFEDDIAPWVHRYANQREGARVVLKQVSDPCRYGVAALDERHILDIEEKPSRPRSSFAVVGLYFYGPEVFDVIRTVRPSARGEYEITSVNNAYIARQQLEYEICQGRWTDAGTFESYFEANRILMERDARRMLRAA